MIVFDVAGTITLLSDLRIRGAFLTIDGFSAPSPGITLRNFGVLVFGTDGAHDVVIRGIRVRDSDQRSCDSSPGSGTGVGILVSHSAYNIWIDHVSVAHSGNAAISVVKGARDVTVSHSILLENENLEQPGVDNPMLISGAQVSSRGDRTTRVSLYRNLFMDGSQRMPMVKWSDIGEAAPEIVADIRNNLVWGWSWAGTMVYAGARANVVGNYYHAPGATDLRNKRAIYLCHEGSVSPQCTASTYPTWVARAHIAGNVSGAGASYTSYLNALGTEASPFPAAPVATTDACTAARQVLAGSGAQPLDAVDRLYLGRVTLACSEPAPTTDAVTTSTATPAPAPEPAPEPAPAPAPTVSKPDLVVTSLVMTDTLQRGVGFHVRFIIENRGTAAAPASELKLYVSRDRVLSRDDVAFRTRHPLALEPGASAAHAFTATIPTTVAPGSYHVLLVADSASAVDESDEANNTLAFPVTVR
jgi:hypothetical protein